MRTPSVIKRILAVPVIARLIAAYQRADGLRFMRWAAAIALFGYLSVFPLAVLAFIAFGITLENYPALRADVEAHLGDALPLLFDPQGAAAPVDIEQVASATRSAGYVSVIALVLTGLGWVSSTIEGVRRMQGAMRRGGNLVSVKLQDLALLIVIGSLVLVALVGSVVVQAAGNSALDWVGLDGEAGWLVQLTAAVVSGLLLWLVLTTVYALSWWRRPHRRWSTITSGALLASVCLVVLLQLSMLVVGRTLSNPVYGTLAVAAALLLFLYVASAVMLYFAAWVAVGEGSPQTQEEVAYAHRNNGGDITLPIMD